LSQKQRGEARIRKPLTTLEQLRGDAMLGAHPSHAKWALSFSARGWYNLTMIKTRSSSTLRRRFYQLGFSAGLVSMETDPYPSARALAEKEKGIVWSAYLNGYRSGQRAQQGTAA